MALAPTWCTVPWPARRLQLRRCCRPALLCAALALTSGALWAQREFREYVGIERDAEEPLPADYRVPGEFVVGRLMYPSNWGRFGGGDWTRGRTAWTVDYPRGDRVFARLLRRLTTVNVRSVEQPVNLDDGDDVYNWPFLIVGLPGAWNLDASQAAKLRDYLLRGGFLLADSFFGSGEWQGFEDTLKLVFPDRPVVELPSDHPIFHLFYDLAKRHQVANLRSLRGRGTPYRNDGVDPHWRAILDDDGRVMVMISYNNDIGDSWQYADIPEYPQEDSNLGIRMGVNYALYALTH